MREGVNVIHLEPMVVVSVRAFGPNPAEEAGCRLRAWAERQGLLAGEAPLRMFGFDVEVPAPGGTERGYELWLAVEPDIQPDGEIQIQEFGGGLYAVARCALDGNPWRVIARTWGRLLNWCRHSRYRMGSHQWLEEPLDHSRALYLPIAEKRGAST